MIVRHGTKPGHQVGVQVMGDDMLYHVDIPLMQNIRSNVNLNECIQLSPLFRGGGELGSRKQRWWWGTGSRWRSVGSGGDLGRWRCRELWW